MSKCMLCLALPIVLGCATTLQPYTETVMAPGTSIEATNPAGTVIITAGEGTRRTYEFGGRRKTVAMTARSERWAGSLGLYDPGTSFGSADRLIAEEGRIHVKSVDEALRWLYTGSAVTRPVYTNSGLVFAYDVAEPLDPGTEPVVYSVEIWQIYVKGKRPTTMPGADDSAIVVHGDGPPKVSEPYPAPVGYPLILGKEQYVPTTRPSTSESEE